ncbi:hypothetical protein BFL35_14835 [Clavibacter michiganensis]|uniref:hypothetical protein n=1 Tax=Clavibacter michiganensis TaxID=28447 RepID=UPI000A360277|nr:hypothetical protein [Clavibacter michiganensis]OUE29481.1 hypothetical protein BFL35_14835 [Clavibacter michiganensis]
MITRTETYTLKNAGTVFTLTERFVQIAPGKFSKKPVYDVSTSSWTRTYGRRDLELGIASRFSVNLKEARNAVTHFFNADIPSYYSN